MTRAHPDLFSGRKVLVAGAATIVIAVAGFFALQFTGETSVVTVAERSAEKSILALKYKGSEACAGCHQAEARLWRTSQHKLAMDHAIDKSVLGDFNDRSFVYYGVRSRFFRRDRKFFVETDGPDGKLAIFEVKYTFGVDPLQQYLIEFQDGRLQALSIAWDSRRKEQGGQRWFHLYPNEPVRHDDALHWTKLNQNWNFMCSECHSTGIRRNYDADRNQFATAWAEISVGCETCHGKGSRHLDWARQRESWWPFAKDNDPNKGLVVHFDERQDVTWAKNPRTGAPERTIAPATLRKEVETCGLCHSRRRQISEDWVPGRSLSETHAVAPISRGLYFPDGQIRDEEETYNYVPFKQSKMFAAGVTCGDCHEPHGAKLRRPGDGVCLGCHSEEFASSAHGHHEAVNPPLGCRSCHMPARTYMVIDRRHDHSFRILRPDLSAKLKIPNACNDCHADRSAHWAASAIETWFGRNAHPFQNYAEAFQAAWTDRLDAGKLLTEVAAGIHVPAVARASALTELASRVSEANIGLARMGLNDSDPMVRIGTLDMLENVPPPQIWTVVAPLLSDPVRGVRIRAASLLASVPTASQPTGDREAFDQAAKEFVAAQHLNADRPEARTTLGAFYAQRGFGADAEREYRSALQLNGKFAPAAVNLADLYRQAGREDQATEVLQAAIIVSPQDAGLHHALGLSHIRAKQAEAALPELRRAAELDPSMASYSYVYAIALNAAGNPQEAIAVLQSNLERHPGHRDTLVALIGFNREIGDLGSALTYAEKLGQISPGDRGLGNLINSLRRDLSAPQR